MSHLGLPFVVAFNGVDIKITNEENTASPAQVFIYHCIHRMEKDLDSVGFILVDESFRPVYMSPESAKILSYAINTPGPGSKEGSVAQKIRSFFPRDFPNTQSVFATNFQSGRRRYHCRAFVLNNAEHSDANAKWVALLLERGLPTLPGNTKRHGSSGNTYGDPFSFAPDSRYYYLSRAHREVFDSLRAVIREGRGVGVLLGKSGMGKTVFLDFLGEKLQPEFEVVRISGSFESGDEVVRGIITLLGASAAGASLPDNLKNFETWLLSVKRMEKGLTLICDEAQCFTTEALEKLCSLTQTKTSQLRCIQIVLAGRQELLEKLCDIQSDKISKQISVFCRLAPLDEAEVCSYILHRLWIAGYTRQMFTADAMSAIALYSRGIPLNINMLCRHALAIAASVNLKLVDERIIADSAYDLVLSTQPFVAGEPPESSDPKRRWQPGQSQDRRGLRLIKKQ